MTKTTSKPRNYNRITRIEFKLITNTIGLQSDGTLIATGLNDSGQCDVGGIDLW